MCTNRNVPIQIFYHPVEIQLILHPNVYFGCPNLGPQRLQVQGETTVTEQQCSAVKIKLASNCSTSVFRYTENVFHSKNLPWLLQISINLKKFTFLPWQHPGLRKYGHAQRAIEFEVQPLGIRRTNWIYVEHVIKNSFVSKMSPFVLPSADK